jgi:hypothetical protein
MIFARVILLYYLHQNLTVVLPTLAMCVPQSSKVRYWGPSSWCIVLFKIIYFWFFWRNFNLCNVRLWKFGRWVWNCSACRRVHRRRLGRGTWHRRTRYRSLNMRFVSTKLEFDSNLPALDLELRFYSNCTYENVWWAIMTSGSRCPHDALMQWSIYFLLLSPLYSLQLFQRTVDQKLMYTAGTYIYAEHGPRYFRAYIYVVR